MNYIFQFICSMPPSSSLFLKVLFKLKYPISSNLNNNSLSVSDESEGSSEPRCFSLADHNFRAICIVSLIISCN